ncbi:MAG: hypothetical protein IJK98_07575, partial [Clostridia bacterium]|nr:hypothetical protein [Clostridia bacterium]
MKQRITKRIFVLFLAMLMVVMSLTPAFAKNAPDVSAETTSGFAGRNAFDVIASNLSDDNSNDDYAISYLELCDGKAYVDIGNADICDVVVAIYDEDTMQMVTSGTAQVPTEHQAVEVEIAAADLPEYYVVKAFLLDAKHNALCKEYTSLMYTRAYEKFLEQTPDDFKNNAVIVFETDEEKEHEDFAVLTDCAVVEDATDGMTFTYNEATATYTFYNATKEAKKLSKGDVYYYQYGERSNEFLLFKVKSVKVSGSMVTVVQDTDIGLADVFQFV